MFDKKAYSKEYRKKNRKILAEKLKVYRQNANIETKELWKQRAKIYNINNPKKRIISAIKSRAKKHNIEFNIDETDINIPDKCPILNIELNKNLNISNKSGPKSNSISIDRLDNSKGYIKSNVQVISNKANIMKHNATPEELLQFAYWILLTYGHLIDKEIS